MAARNMTNGIRHGQHCEAEGQCDACKANSQLREGRREHRRAAATEHKPSRSYKLCNELAGHCITLPSSNAQRGLLRSTSSTGKSVRRCLVASERFTIRCRKRGQFPCPVSSANFRRSCPQTLSATPALWDRDES